MFDFIEYLFDFIECVFALLLRFALLILVYVRDCNVVGSLAECSPSSNYITITICIYMHIYTQIYIYIYLEYPVWLSWPEIADSSAG